MMSATPDFADGNTLSMLVGDCTRSRVLHVLLFFDDRKLSKQEIAEYAGVTRQSVYPHINHFKKINEFAGEDEELFLLEGEDGKVRLNHDHDLVDALNRVEWAFLSGPVCDADKNGDVSEFLAELGDPHHEE